MQGILRRAAIFLGAFCALTAGLSSTAAAQTTGVSCEMTFSIPGGGQDGFTINSTTSNVFNVNNYFQPNTQYTASLQNCTQTMASTNWSVNNQQLSGASPTFTTPAGGTQVSVSVQAVSSGSSTLNGTLNASTTNAAAPVCSISGPASAAPGSTITLNAVNCTNAPTSYFWHGNPLSGQGTAQVTYQITATSGRQDFFLNPSNTSFTGPLASLSVAVQTAAVPVCTLTAAPAAVASGASSTLTANCTNSPTSYTWTNTNFPSTASSGTVTPTGTTTYTVTATNSAGTSAPARATVTVTSANVPVCTISGAPTAPVAAGSATTLVANCTGAPETYQWSTGGAAFASGATATSVTVRPTSTTTYSLIAMSSTSGTSLPASATIQVAGQAVNLKPTSTAALIAMPGAPFQLEVQVTDNSVSALPVVGATVNWVVQSGTGDTLSSPTSITDAAGKAQINVTLANASGPHVVRASTAGAAPYDFTVNSAADVVLRPATQITQAMLQTAIQVSQSQLYNIRTRLDQIRAKRGANVSSANVKVTAQGTAIPLDQIADAFKGKNAPQGRGASSDEFEHWGFFINGNVDIGKQTPSGGQGFDLTSRGLTAGVDYQINGGHVIGAGVGYARSNTDLLGDSGKQNSNGQSLSLYGSFVPTEKMYVDLALNHGRLSFNTDRRLLNFNGVTTETANSNADSKQTAFSVTGGADFYKDALRLNPYVRYETIRASVDGFTESGSSQNLQVGNLEMTTKSFTVGAQTTYAISTSFGVVTPQARLEFTRQNTSNPNAVIASLANGGSPMSLARIDQTGNFGMAGLGVTVMLARGVNAYLNYETMFSKADASLYRWAFGMSIPF